MLSGTSQNGYLGEPQKQLLGAGIIKTYRSLCIHSAALDGSSNGAYTETLVMYARANGYFLRGGR